MRNAEFCMFCYYRNKRIAACSHAAAKPDARSDTAGGTPTTVPPAVAARPQVQPPQPKSLR